LAVVELEQSAEASLALDRPGTSGVGIGIDWSGGKENEIVFALVGSLPPPPEESRP
jgi:hypothetical protein